MAEALIKQANALRVEENNTDAGATFMKAAESFLQQDVESIDAASAYVSAANCYVDGRYSEAVRILHLAIDIYVKKGMFSLAAEHLQYIGDTHPDMEESLDHYKKASKFYKIINATSRWARCTSEAATVCGKLKRYEEAIELFESAAVASLKNPLLKWGARNLLLKAILCRRVLGNKQDVAEAMKKYQEWDPTIALATHQEPDAWSILIMGRIKEDN